MSQFKLQEQQHWTSGQSELFPFLFLFLFSFNKKYRLRISSKSVITYIERKEEMTHNSFFKIKPMGITDNEPTERDFF